MSAIASLRTLIKESAQLQISSNSVKLSEKGKEATLKELSIVSLGSETFGIIFEKISGRACPLFAEGPECNRACEAIIFCELRGERYILICEMKSTLPHSKNYEAQLKSASCFLDYLNSILRHFYDSNLEGWRRKYFLFHSKTTSISKRPSWPKLRDNSTPERALHVQVANKEQVYLRKLLGLESI